MDSANFHNVYHHLHERYTFHILYIGNNHLSFHICHLRDPVLCPLVDTVALADPKFAFGFDLSIVSMGLRLGIVASECLLFLGVCGLCRCVAGAGFGCRVRRNVGIFRLSKCPCICGTFSLA